MIAILCTVSAADFNDDIVPSLIHFGLQANLKERPIYVSYIKEENRLRITRTGEESRELSVTPAGKESVHYQCIRRFISEVKKGDILYANRLSDFGDSADEAADIYFRLLQKEIQISFYDCTHLNTEVLKITAAPSQETRLLINRMIDDYFMHGGRTPRITQAERNQILEMKRSKKKSADNDCAKGSQRSGLQNKL